MSGSDFRTANLRGTRIRDANLTKAISLMGISSLESLVLSMGVSKAIPNEAVGGFDPKLFWQGSARRAYIAKALSQHLHPQKNMESFTAGLLQDMALPFLVKRKTEAYENLLKTWDNGERILHEMEKEGDVLRVDLEQFHCGEP